MLGIKNKIKIIVHPANLESTKPVSTKFGFDRGLPIDRYYIEKFLNKNKKYIKGSVLEISENKYTKKFGGNRVKKSMVINYKKTRGVNLVANLETGSGVLEELADCFIMTQTLPFVFDISNVIKNSLKLLKKGGVLLITTPGITQISRYDMDRWGQYWSLTDLAIKKLFSEFVTNKNIHTETYGNVKSSSLFLYGLSASEVDRGELDYNDPNYQLVVCARITKWRE